MGALRQIQTCPTLLLLVPIGWFRCCNMGLCWMRQTSALFSPANMLFRPITNCNRMFFFAIYLIEVHRSTYQKSRKKGKMYFFYWDNIALDGPHENESVKQLHLITWSSASGAGGRWVMTGTYYPSQDFDSHSFIDMVASTPFHRWTWKYTRKLW